MPVPLAAPETRRIRRQAAPSLGSAAIVEAYGFRPPLLWRGDVTGLFTAIFLHGGWAHLGANSAFILAFGGKGGSFGGLWGGPYRGAGEPHESPLTITIPLVLLAIASIVAGYWFGFYAYLTPGAPTLNLGVILSDWKTWVGVVVAFIGLGWAYALYGGVEFAKIHEFVENRPALRVTHQILLRKFYVDDLYSALIKYVVLGLCHIAAAFDTYIVDGIVNGAAGLVRTSGRDLSHVETGRVQSYMVGFFGGVAVLAIAVIVLVTFMK